MKRQYKEFISLDEDEIKSDNVDFFSENVDFFPYDYGSYYNEKDNIFLSIPPNNLCFIDKTYEEIKRIDSRLTIVLANIKNPPSLIFKDYSFIHFGFHKRLIKYTPPNCSCVITKIMLIADKKLFDMYDLLLKKPENIIEINTLLRQKDFFCGPTTMEDIKAIQNILFTNVFDKTVDNILFGNVDTNYRLKRRKFNFNTIRECVDSDQYIMDRLETIRGDYDRVQTGITNNTIFYDERNAEFYEKYSKNRRKEDETSFDFVNRIELENKNKIIRWKKEYLQIKELIHNLKKLIVNLPKSTDNFSRINPNALNDYCIMDIIDLIIQRLFYSHKHYIFALRDIKDLQNYGYIEPDSVWNAIYAHYVEECNSNIKVGTHTFRNYSNKNTPFLFTEQDIDLLNYIKDLKFMEEEGRRESIWKGKDLFIPLKRDQRSEFRHLPDNFETGEKRQNYRINSLEKFKERFEIFSRGMFKNFDWINNGILVSGSCITACLAHYNKCGETKEEFEKYIDKHYTKSDIDICTANYLLPTLQKNLYELFLLKEPDSSISFFSKIQAENKDKILEKHFSNNKCKYCGHIQQDFIGVEIHEIKCILATKHIKDETRFGERIYKLSIDPPKGKSHFRSIDAYTNDLGKIGLYHMPCVRAAYSGEHIYMYPSFVCAALSGYCPDYKWFKGKKNPLRIILDKWMKGYNIILNQQEQQQLISYYIYNYREKAINTPVLSVYKDRWDLVFGNPDSVKRICHRIFMISEKANAKTNDLKTIHKLSQLLWN